MTPYYFSMSVSPSLKTGEAPRKRDPPLTSFRSFTCPAAIDEAQAPVLLTTPLLPPFFRAEKSGDPTT